MAGQANGQVGTVHCAILRTARQGKEREFEEALSRFISRSMLLEETAGAHIIHPSEASRPREYGILRAFRSVEARDRFYESEMFQEWIKEVEPLVEGEPVQHSLHGLEAFFRSGGQTSPPPRWKMAFVTWLGVFPVVLLWSRLLPPYLKMLHPVGVTAVVTAIAVITLAWFVMPALTRILAGWLHSQQHPPE